MAAQVNTVAFEGMTARLVNVQVQLSTGLPAFIIVGLPDKAVAESRERIRAALTSLGLSLPAKRIIVNLSPADISKEGSHFDLPIILALFVALEILPQDELNNYLSMGEISLDGALQPVSGALLGAMEACHQELGFICPHQCGGEAAWAGDINILAPSHILELLNHFKGTQVLTPPTPKKIAPQNYNFDLSDIKGQETAKRALEIAAAGNHNLLFKGPPGAGKSMMAARLATILPPLTPREALDVTIIHSIAGQLKEGSLIQTRPFRDPHHTASLVALAGGGLKAKPGEVSLAHAGVLFLDELPEFSRGSLEVLRQPLESGKIMISRANAHITYPACFQLVAAMNPCRCGYIDTPELSCGRAPRCGQDYQSKISGPLLDRIDLSVFVAALKPHEMSTIKPGETSQTISHRINQARLFQQERHQHLQLPVTANAQLSAKDLEHVAVLDSQSTDLLNRAAEKFNLSTRGYHRVIKLARTIADLELSAAVRQPHIAEALGYRNNIAAT